MLPFIFAQKGIHFLRQREAPCVRRSSVVEMLYKLTGFAGDTGSLLYGVYLVLLNSQRQ